MTSSAGRSGAGMSWPAYTEQARRLAELARAESAQREQLAAAGHSGQGRLDALAARLAAQHRYLSHLARLLRLPAPHLGTVAASGVTDADEALAKAAEATAHADAEARHAEHRGAQPPLLPGLSPVGRAAVVYTVTAFTGTLATIGLYAVSPNAEFGRIPVGLAPWSLCGLPALAFFAGYLTLVLFGQPRIGAHPGHQLRLGGLICFVGMPVVWLLFIALTLT